ncbi:SOS response-associated peptidase [Limibacillus sp. MBR-115]|uniref:SOS response-associated peptidase n=1 Tax=Limibacillus sp. MBR-115 TaxID=3156465 RepID=UPI0033923A62
MAAGVKGLRITAVSLAFRLMCGRFLLTSPVESLGRLFGFPERPNLAPRYNIAPTQSVAVVRSDPELAGHHLALLRWGLVPFWAKSRDIGARMINARAETLAEKPAFRAAFRYRRCLILADGFYEWQKREDGTKQPYVIQRRDLAPFAFAGLWESWEEKEQAATLETCSIVTTGANDVLRPVHHRMPVILEGQEACDQWLRPTSGSADLQQLLRPAAEEAWVARPVSSRVNKVTNDGAGLLDAPEDATAEMSDEDPDGGEGSPHKAIGRSTDDPDQGSLF